MATKPGDPTLLFLREVGSRNAFEETVAQLVRAIRFGIVTPGSKFPAERELSERLNVSRTTVREAIRSLEEFGYVETRRGRFGGTFLVHPEGAAPEADRAKREALQPELGEAVTFREALEPGVARLAARLATGEDVSRLEALCDGAESASAEAYIRLNSQFHLALAEITDSDTLVKAVAEVEVKVMDALLVVPRMEGSVEHSHEQHRAIVAAVAARDADGARAAMEEHLGGTAMILREILG
jgi:GntR family transcriptional regulator, transcriptional repressor for pyruvate dehydrogenase complex